MIVAEENSNKIQLNQEDYHCLFLEILKRVFSKNLYKIKLQVQINFKTI